MNTLARILATEFTPKKGILSLLEKGSSLILKTDTRGYIQRNPAKIYWIKKGRYKVLKVSRDDPSDPSSVTAVIIRISGAVKELYGGEDIIFLPGDLKGSYVLS